MKTLLIQTIKSDWLFIIPASLAFFSASIITLWDFVRVQEMKYSVSLTSVVGLILFVTGIIIRRAGKKTLGRYYTYGLRTLQDHKLVKHGIYRHIRHPISLAMLMYSVGITLIFSSLRGLLIMSALIPLTLYRIRIEEDMLIEKFGDEYQEYMNKTKK